MYPRDVHEAFPADSWMRRNKAQSYIGQVNVGRATKMTVPEFAWFAFVIFDI